MVSLATASSDALHIEAYLVATQADFDPSLVFLATTLREIGGSGRVWFFELEQGEELVASTTVISAIFELSR